MRASAVLLAVAAPALMLSAAAIPWGSLSVDTRLGPVPVSLRAEVLEYGVSYEANLEGAGPLGGGGAMPPRVKESRVFLTGLGDFQETIGFIKGTSKEKVVYVTSYTWPPPENGTAESKVTTFVRTIPWWPVGLEQEAGLTVELTGATNVSELVVEMVWIELHRTIQGEDRSKRVWEASPGDALRMVGERRTYAAGITIDEDCGEFRLVAGARLHLRDSFNNSNMLPDGNYSELASPPRNITLWTMGAATTIRIGLMLAAFPVTVAAAALVLLSPVALHLGRRWAWRLCLTGAALAVLAMGFYILGVQALIDLTGYGKWFSWSPGIGAAVAGALLSLASAALLFLSAPPAPRKRGGVPEGGQKSGAGMVSGERPGDARRGVSGGGPGRGGERPGGAGEKAHTNKVNNQENM
ncbi:MAG: hypothetical protein ACUVV6_05895 [Thermoplasmatota archaeon]